MRKRSATYQDHMDAPGKVCENACKPKGARYISSFTQFTANRTSEVQFMIAALRDLVFNISKK